MEAAKLLSTVSALLECGYCLEKFQNPRNLPCGHTFCLSCLQSQVNNKKTTNSYSCGLCRHPWTIPDGGLSSLPKNYVVDSFTSISAAAECSQKRDGEEHGPGEHFCVECWEPLCMHVKMHINEINIREITL